jgi:hypothetical protein
MTIECRLPAMAGGFTRTISQALFAKVLFPNFCTSTVYATARDVGCSELSRSPFVGSSKLCWELAADHGRVTGHSEVIHMNRQAVTGRSIPCLPGRPRSLAAPPPPLLVILRPAAPGRRICVTASPRTRQLARHDHLRPASDSRRFAPKPNCDFPYPRLWIASV